MAKELGVSDEAVRLYATGKRMPRPKVMEEIHRVTGGAVQPNDFFQLSSEGAAEESTEDETADSHRSAAPGRDVA